MCTYICCYLQFNCQLIEFQRALTGQCDTNEEIMTIQTLQTEIDHRISTIVGIFNQLKTMSQRKEGLTKKYLDLAAKRDKAKESLIQTRIRLGSANSNRSSKTSTAASDDDDNNNNEDMMDTLFGLSGDDDDDFDNRVDIEAVRAFGSGGNKSSQVQHSTGVDDSSLVNESTETKSKLVVDIKENNQDVKKVIVLHDNVLPPLSSSSLSSPSSANQQQNATNSEESDSETDTSFTITTPHTNRMQVNVNDEKTILLEEIQELESRISLVDETISELESMPMQENMGSSSANNVTSDQYLSRTDIVHGPPRSAKKSVSFRSSANAVTTTTSSNPNESMISISRKSIVPTLESYPIVYYSGDDAKPPPKVERRLSTVRFSFSNDTVNDTVNDRIETKRDTKDTAATTVRKNMNINNSDVSAEAEILQLISTLPSPLLQPGVDKQTKGKEEIKMHDVVLNAITQPRKSICGLRGRVFSTKEDRAISEAGTKHEDALLAQYKQQQQEAQEAQISEGAAMININKQGDTGKDNLDQNDTVNSATAGVTTGVHRGTFSSLRRSQRTTTFTTGTTTGLNSSIIGMIRQKRQQRKKRKTRLSINSKRKTCVQTNQNGTDNDSEHSGSTDENAHGSESHSEEGELSVDENNEKIEKERHEVAAAKAEAAVRENILHAFLVDDDDDDDDQGVADEVFLNGSKGAKAIKHDKAATVLLDHGQGLGLGHGHGHGQSRGHDSTAGVVLTADAPTPVVVTLSEEHHHTALVFSRPTMSQLVLTKKISNRRLKSNSLHAIDEHTAGDHDHHDGNDDDNDNVSTNENVDKIKDDATLPLSTLTNRNGTIAETTTFDAQRKDSLEELPTSITLGLHQLRPVPPPSKPSHIIPTKESSTLSLFQRPGRATGIVKKFS